MFLTNICEISDNGIISGDINLHIDYISDI